MPNLIDGIDLLIVTDQRQVQQSALRRSLVLEVDAENRPVSLHYFDVLGKNKLDLANLNISELQNIAHAKAVDITQPMEKLLYINSQELTSILSNNLTGIRGREEIITKYFQRHPENFKLSRKDSGLMNSFVRSPNSNKDILTLESKNECRVVWQDTPPDKEVFNNLPPNTSAAYIVVKAANSDMHDIYYILNDNNSKAIKLTAIKNPGIFKKFKFNNSALSREALEEITDTIRHRHENISSNVLGRGGFGKVKKSFSVAYDTKSKVTKIQNLPSEKKFQSKMSDRKARLQAMKQEAAIGADVAGGDEDIVVAKDKAYMHMQELGKPLSTIVPKASFDQKVDIAIKFLIALSKMHRGETKSGTRYAHRDIKLENVLYNTSTEEVNLIDFGMATSNISDKSEVSGGTLFYAPLDQKVIDDYLKSRNTPLQKVSVASMSERSEVDSIVDSNLDFLGDTDEELPTPGEVYISAKKNLDWQHFLANKDLCLTKNYLEDDKIAALRTIYCNPQPVKSDMVLSLFDVESFAKFPKPIRDVFDATKIAPLLNKGRRSETMDFFAAVLITYKFSPNLTDEEYVKIITELRQQPVKQLELQRAMLDVTDVTDTTSETTISEDDSPKYTIKNKPDNKQGFFRSMTSFFRKSSAVSPQNEEEKQNNMDDSPTIPLKKK